ncbi:hypothetical protein L2E82_22011 [Cichorium intybus]|uniref:Uncharacterized protein n=1 Tax=Cichorium intybus TaxID=13427 RepID=A0ACB9DWU3_CICIN|nr:hypothetical protein L2E82_22011 [Cichorium intybus]
MPITSNRYSIQVSLHSLALLKHFVFRQSLVRKNMEPEVGGSGGRQLAVGADKCGYTDHDSRSNLFLNIKSNSPTLNPNSIDSSSDSVIQRDSVQATVTMVKAIRVYEFGGPEVMKWEDVELDEPKKGEIKVRNKAIGINYLEVYMRKGLVPRITPPSPFTPGMEAAGVVIAVGPEVTTCKVGDMVAYAGYPVGAYTEEQILPADRVVPVPPSLDPVIAASVLFKGLTALVLVRRCLQTGPEHTILVHAAAGGVGSLVCQWANALGATVIGTVSNKVKAVQAKEDGCHHVIIYKEEKFVDRVMEITSRKGVDVVYDSVGKDTFEGSVACLKAGGYLVLYGQASGSPEHVNLQMFFDKFLHLEFPSVMFYTQARKDLLEASEELFSNVAKGVLRVRANHKYPLSQVTQAHLDLEDRKTIGSIVLIPDNQHLPDA